MSMSSTPENRPAYLFKPGVSGNPGGLPREVRIARKLAAQMSPKAIKTLEKWMDSDDARASIAACMAILERGLGKAAAMRELYPPKGAAHSNPLIPVHDMTNDQLERILRIAHEQLP